MIKGHAIGPFQAIVVSRQWDETLTTLESIRFEDVNNREIFSVDVHAIPSRTSDRTAIATAHLMAASYRMLFLLQVARDKLANEEMAGLVSKETVVKHIDDLLEILGVPNAQDKPPGQPS